MPRQRVTQQFDEAPKRSRGIHELAEDFPVVGNDIFKRLRSIRVSCRRFGKKAPNCCPTSTRSHTRSTPFGASARARSSTKRSKLEIH
jgi:hypothetical protein